MIRRLREEGKTIFVTTHYMDEAENCGRIALMRTGELIALDTPGGLKTRTFPHPLYELTPLHSLSPSQISGFQADPSLKSLQPYGIRYHAIIKSPQAWDEAKTRFAASFAIRPVEPSLEDVFIELVEGREEQ